MTLDIKNFKIENTEKMVDFVNNTLYLEVETYENDGDNVEKEYISIDNQIELDFYKCIIKNYNKYDPHTYNLSEKLFEHIKANNELEYVKSFFHIMDADSTIKNSTENDLIIFLDIALTDLLGCQSNSSELRVLDRYKFCFFNIEENKKITVVV